MHRSLLRAVVLGLAFLISPAGLVVEDAPIPIVLTSGSLRVHLSKRGALLRIELGRTAFAEAPRKTISCVCAVGKNGLVGPSRSSPLIWLFGNATPESATDLLEGQMRNGPFPTSQPSGVA